LGAIQAVAPSLGVELRPVDVQNPDEIERAIAAFAGASRNGGLIVTAGTFGVAHRGAIRWQRDTGCRPFIPSNFTSLPAV
jgi:putative ABC transport system substrate-binding protein